jgi:hypothetical protein
MALPHLQAAPLGVPPASARRRAHPPAAAAAAPPPPPASAATAAANRLRERLRAGVLAEQAEARRQADVATARASPAALEAAGVAVFDLEARQEGRLYGDLVLLLQRRGGAPLPPHRLRAGDSVALRWDGGGEEATVLEGRESGGAALRIALPPAAAARLAARPAGARGALRAESGGRDATSARQLAALDALGELRDPDSAGERAMMALLLGSPRAAELAARPPTWAARAAWRADAKELLGAGELAGLNASQRRAVATALGRSATLWQGPPGTGKSSALIALLRLLATLDARSIARREGRLGPVLAVADTNAAADHLLEGLLARGVDAVRAGPPAKVRPALRHACLDARAEAASRDAAPLRDQAARQLAGAAAAAARGAISVAELAGARREAGRALAAADAEVADAAAYVLDAAQVVVATCAASGEPRLGDRVFRCVALDEATQATEPSALVPLLRGAEWLVAAGDHRQLPPTVVSRGALAAGLDVPLFSRLRAAGVPSALLAEQYRMHPAIAEWPSARFYGGAVRDGVAAAARPPPSGVRWRDAGVPVAFLDCAGAEERARGGGAAEAVAAVGGGGGGASYRNRAQTALALAAAARLLADASVASVAVLAPYSGQVRLLEAGAGASAPLAAALAAGRLRLSSVDGFQGQEADAVVFTTVRANARRALGFVADARRLNVALTRARRALLVVGCGATLSGDANWAAWLAWVESAGGAEL